MLEIGDHVLSFSLPALDGPEHLVHPGADGTPLLLVFLEADCPTCHLTLPYLNALKRALGGNRAPIVAISQDPAEATRTLAQHYEIEYPVLLDRRLEASRRFDPPAVPALFLIDGQGRVARIQIGFDKGDLNAIAQALSQSMGLVPLTIAEEFDGAPVTKPGCSSRHLEACPSPDPDRAPPFLPENRAEPASRFELDGGVDPFAYCAEVFGDPLPVIPPTVERVERFLAETPLAPQEIVARIPPNYGIATVEKSAANAVMAGCTAAMMRVLVPLVRAVCDEQFNLHGIQATTHFAAPLIILNGPVRLELGFTGGNNLFSNVVRANSSVGRALQLLLSNVGGARPGGIDMSTLGNPGKFSYCIAENEEESPWEPLQVGRGFTRGESTVTLFAAEPPRGVSEHNARSARQVLLAICRALATVWTYRMCGFSEAVVILCPEHARTIRREGYSKQDVQQFFYDHTGIPQRCYEDGDGEGVQYTSLYSPFTLDGEPCFRKFASPEAITVLVAGGTAGKFSAVIGSWAAGPRGSRMVTYPIRW